MIVIVLFVVLFVCRLFLCVVVVVCLLLVLFVFVRCLSGSIALLVLPNCRLFFGIALCSFKRMTTTMWHFQGSI